MTTPITIVIPAYGEVDALRSCLASVVAHTPAPRARVVVIDDATPEGPLADALSMPAGALDLRVVRNEENLGFAGSANRGMAEAGGDVVLLNSDTVVVAGWLERLAATASSASDVATVTPLTNHGSICTLPPAIVDAFDLDGPAPRIDACGVFVEHASLRLRPAVVTGVGFCLYVTRQAIDQVGLLDEGFRPGYGEEVDFCLRASAQGLRHLVDDATFVWHRGETTFGAASEARAAGTARVHQLHPGFRVTNAYERANDPLWPVHAALTLALDERVPGRPHVLHLLHAPSPFGGTEKHVAALSAAIADDYDVSVLCPASTGFVLHCEWTSVRGRRCRRSFQLDATTGERAEPDDPTAIDALRAALTGWPADVVHVQNLIGHSVATFDVLRDFAGVVVCTIHDLYLACPNHSLLYLGREPCGIPDDLSVCARCLPETRDLDVDDLQRFRAAVAAGIDVVDHWVVASQSAADYLLRAYPVPAERIHLIPHGSVAPPEPRPPLDPTHVEEAPLQVAFVGRGWGKKGLDIVNALAADVAGDGITIHHLGEQRDPIAPEVQAHGPYDNRRLPELLDRYGIHVVLIPGPYAETFGFVMTESLLGGRPVIGPPYGAIAERIRVLGTGWTVDPDEPGALTQLVMNLDRCRDELMRATVAARQVPIEPVASGAGAYTRLYRAKVAP
jgi:GT2 family glycosyltransferase/glycosyltransferase involved in cell wall biosynthesis